MDINVILDWAWRLGGLIGGILVTLLVWIYRNNNKQTNERIDVLKSDTTEVIKRLEETLSELHKDHQQSKTNCTLLVAQLQKGIDETRAQIKESELLALRVYADKAELNAARADMREDVKGFHRRLDGLFEILKPKS